LGPSLFDFASDAYSRSHSFLVRVIFASTASCPFFPSDPIYGSQKPTAILLILKERSKRTNKAVQKRAFYLSIGPSFFLSHHHLQTTPALETYPVPSASASMDASDETSVAPMVTDNDNNEQSLEETQEPRETQPSDENEGQQSQGTKHLWGYLLPCNPHSRLERIDFRKGEIQVRIGRDHKSNDWILPGFKISCVPFVYNFELV
jgi:hypothetical protein